MIKRLCLKVKEECGRSELGGGKLVGLPSILGVSI